MKKYFAFTLTEVMITVGIIGVVAALTVPDLVKNYQQETQIVALRKVVNEFENAVDMYITEEGKKYFRQTAAMKSDTGMQSFMQNKFKLRSGSGFATTYRSINGNTADFTCSGSTYSLANSATLCVKLSQPLSTSSSVAGDTYKRATEYHVYVDVNGDEKPNVGGRDMFDFYVGPSGNIGSNSFDPIASEGEDTACNFVACAEGAECTISPEDQAKIDKCEEDKTCLGKPFGEGCLAKVIHNNWKPITDKPINRK